ncbi:hypothetical protein LCGC14_0392000 [marine sediment metagenome]|uniref:Carbon storage regulator n=1 Tax=marine sediment metagenome TaxID=412755 RepID=A0A0F9VLB1_9ZZZZ
MLVLGRYVGEEISIIVNDKELGRIKLCDIRGEKARIGFEFPGSVKIMRSELVDNKTPDERNENELCAICKQKLWDGRDHEPYINGHAHCVCKQEVQGRVNQGAKHEDAEYLVRYRAEHNRGLFRKRGY